MNKAQQILQAVVNRQIANGAPVIEEMRVVKMGIGTLDKPMTQKQALNYGIKNMPMDLKRAGFACSVFVSDSNIHGGTWFRINYSK